jgi:hypothetical protein
MARAARRTNAVEAATIADGSTQHSGVSRGRWMEAPQHDGVGRGKRNESVRRGGDGESEQVGQTSRANGGDLGGQSARCIIIVKC